MLTHWRGHAVKFAVFASLAVVDAHAHNPLGYFIAGVMTAGAFEELLLGMGGFVQWWKHMNALDDLRATIDETRDALEEADRRFREQQDEDANEEEDS